MRRLYLIANWMQGTGLSGGDRIFIELVKRWKTKLKITLLLSKEGLEICKQEGLTGVDHRIWASDRFSQRGYFMDYSYRTLVCLRNSVGLDVTPGDIVYSSSDFWPDALPAFFLKMRNPRIFWIAGFYLFPPAPWQKDTPYKGKKWLLGLFYWLSQLPAYYLVKKFADRVFVTSEPDVEKFVTDKRKADKIIVIRGGVDIAPSEKYLKFGNIIPVEQRKYDACFVGRFHYQKGVIELLKIWKTVCNKKLNAQLVLIGNGPLESEVRQGIKNLGLQANIELLGFRNGEEKYEVFKQSKIIVHPAIYDSGGMAAAEGMAWRLPGVSFDLEALKTYYPKGMLKTPQFDLERFAENICSLLDDKQLYERISTEALEWARQWDWEKREQEIYGQIGSQ